MPRIYFTEFSEFKRVSEKIQDDRYKDINIEYVFNYYGVFLFDPYEINHLTIDERKKKISDRVISENLSKPEPPGSEMQVSDISFEQRQFWTVGHTAILSDMNTGGLQSTDDPWSDGTKVIESIIPEVINEPYSKYFLKDDSGSERDGIGGKLIRTALLRPKVKMNTDDIEKIRSYCRDQIGKYYNILSYVWSDDSWYCSKLVYRAYIDCLGIDIAGYQGYWILPMWILNSKELDIYYEWES